MEFQKSFRSVRIVKRWICDSITPSNSMAKFNLVHWLQGQNKSYLQIVMSLFDYPSYTITRCTKVFTENSINRVDVGQSHLVSWSWSLIALELWKGEVDTHVQNPYLHHFMVILDSEYKPCPGYSITRLYTWNTQIRGR